MKYNKNIFKYAFISCVFLCLATFIVWIEGGFDKTLNSIPASWHGTYTLDKNHIFWDSEEYDFNSSELRCIVSKNSVYFLGDDRKIIKIKQGRTKSSKNRFQAYYDSDKRFEFVFLDDPNIIFVNDEWKTPAGPDSESWGIMASYKFSKNN